MQKIFFGKRIRKRKFKKNIFLGNGCENENEKIFFGKRIRKCTKIFFGKRIRKCKKILFWETDAKMQQIFFWETDKKTKMQKKYSLENGYENVYALFVKTLLTATDELSCIEKMDDLDYDENDVVKFPIQANMLTQEILIEFKGAQFGSVRKLQINYGGE